MWGGGEGGHLEDSSPCAVRYRGLDMACIKLATPVFFFLQCLSPSCLCFGISSPSPLCPFCPSEAISFVRIDSLKETLYKKHSLNDPVSLCCSKNQRLTKMQFLKEIQKQP